MEAAALSPWHEKLAALLIPPGARESVMGDLRESCETEAELLCEVLRATPYVIVSQMRRNLNWPALLLKSGLVFWCLGAIAASVMLPLFLLRDAYQPLSRPSPRHALRDAVLMSFCGMLVFLLLPMGWPKAMHSVFISCFFLGAPLSLLLCLVRTGLILDGDRRGKWMGSKLSKAEMVQLWRGHRRGVIRRNRLEAVLLALGAVWLPVLAVNGQTPALLAAMFAAAALWLVLDVPRRRTGQDFVSLRAAYSQSLLHQQQLRGFLWWLWLSPVLMWLQARLAGGSSPLQILQTSIIAVLLCFLVTVLNREGRGRMQEEVVALSRLRETPA
jgi:hypothetical protein